MSIYLPLNRYNVNTNIIKFSLDDKIPFVPQFIIPYILYYPLPFFVVLYSFRYNKVKQTTLAFIFVYLMSYAIFILYPTSVMRPLIITTSDIFSQAVKKLYEIDKPYNALPSIHNGISVLSLLILFTLNRKIGMISAPFILLIILSTLLIKQHYIIDVIAGAIVSFLSYEIFIKRDYLWKYKKS